MQFQQGAPIHDWRAAIVWLLLLAGTGFLMVSSWRFWSGKEITSGGRLPFQVVVLLGLGLILIWLFHRWVLILIALGYLVSGVLARLAYAWQRRRRMSPGAPA